MKIRFVEDPWNKHGTIEVFLRTKKIASFSIPGLTYDNYLAIEYFRGDGAIIGLAQNPYDINDQLYGQACDEIVIYHSEILGFVPVVEPTQAGIKIYMEEKTK